MSSAAAANESAIPVIDLGPSFGNGEGRKRVAAEIDAACRGAGFFYVVNHGVAEETMRQMFEASRAFFARPPQEKLAIATSRSPCSRGYDPLEAQAFDAARPPDLKESFFAGVEVPETDPYVLQKVPYYGPNQWPDEPAGFRPAVETAHAALLALGRHVLRLFALALTLPEHHFDRCMELPIALLRLLHYPPAPAQPTAGQLGIGTHTDWGALTLLAQDGVGGLEVQHVDGGWMRATPIPGAFLLNIGDMMQRWTNDVYRSTPHRVINDAAGRDRYSAAMFVDLNYFTRVECLPSCVGPDRPARHAPCTAGEHIAEMYRKTFSKAA